MTHSENAPGAPAPIDHAVAAGASATPILGTFRGLDADGRAVVAIDDDGTEFIAVVAAPCPEGALGAARGRQVVLLFERGDPRRPVIVGWVQELPAADPPERRYVRVDGRVLVLEGQQEVELRCGEASILLHRDGRIELRGRTILSEAREMQRIRGAAVRIN